MTGLQLHGVRKDHDGRTVIPHLDLVVPARKLVVLVGPSGCGKSTTLRLIAGLDEPDAGRISIGERDVTTVPANERDVAMVFQSYALYPHMTVFENLAFGLRGNDLDEAEIRRRVDRVADRLGLRAELERRPEALSGGQRQRVAIGRAVVRRPAVFLFDEPLANLDTQLRTAMRREIARIHEEAKATSVYVTHDQIEAMTLADQLVVMNAGVVQQSGTPAEIYDRPANRFVAGFFGSPAMNFLAADVHATGARRAARGVGFEIPLHQTPAAGKIVVGIRPERLSLVKRNDDVAVAGAVAVREVLGAEVVLHVESAAGPLAVRTDASAPARPGDTVAVWLDPKAIHLFDGTTEQRLP